MVARGSEIEKRERERAARERSLATDSCQVAGQQEGRDRGRVRRRSESTAKDVGLRNTDSARWQGSKGW